MVDYGIKGKTAIVTGTGAVGSAVAELLMQEGANVVIGTRTVGEELLEKARQRTEKYEGENLVFKTDVSDESSLQELFAHALERFGAVDIIVNNAGVWPTSYVKDMEVEDFRKTLDVNLIGPFILSKQMVNYCLEHGRKGKIVNMTSQAAFHGSTSGHAHYASSKAGLVGFTISLAREVAQYGINVNAVAPGIVESRMVSAIVDDPERRARYLERIPVRKIATGEDVAKIVLFLCSTQSDYMTGATLDVTGGMLMR